MLRSVTMGFTDIWILIAALAGIVTIPQEVNGECHYQGQLFANNSSWKPDSCQDCICAHDIVVCRTPQCLNPQCDFQKGGILRILPNKCCPECVLQSQDSCHYEGSIYGHGSQWNGSRCSLCTCSQGTVSCNPLTCRPLNCGKGQTPSTLPGECCPQCQGSGASCSADGLVFRDGGQWYPSPCMKCVCSAGETQCFVAECQSIVCKPHENLVVHPGKCCPQCEPDSCLVVGTEYKHGEQWLKSSCTTCRCDHGQERCHTQTCPPVTCKKGQNAVKRAGQCCEDCVSPKGTCVYQGMVRYHGDMWNITGCEFCTCDRGQVLCRKADCGTVKCSWGEELVHFPGKCCPECRSVSSNCVFKQQTYQNLERWNDGPCRQCECRDSHAACYQRSCPTCRPGSLAVARPGGCCPECHTAQCYAECLTCSQSPDHCDSCENPQAVLHEGRCLPVCPSGFYQNGRVCTACPRSCAACENAFECTSCSGILLMSRRQCVSTCDRGFYQDHGQCSRCHDSCSSCHGATPQDCLSCSAPSHLLKDGLCVGACGPGFYTEQGTCNACDSSCLTCYPDNPSCASCSPASALHHGKCVPHCPEQHYRDGMGMCRVCHSSCAACTGPSVAHCSRCHPPQSLHLGQCVDACGEGLYAQDGHCQSCHTSCRSCTGPSPSDCTRCLKPEEVLQLEPGQAARGVCASSCTDRFYLDTDQTCKGCHASCLECTHGGHLNCTACSPALHLHQGQCLQRCPQGFYSQDRACHACHPSCRTCSGPSDADCTACLPHAELQGATCVTSCPQGQYLTTLGQCTGCHESCQRCVADPHKDGGICLWCQDPRTLLLGGLCVSRCPPGHYGSLGACKRCHISCQSCSGGGPSSCTSCPPPMVLSPSGLCTQLCPLGYYANVDRVCHACDSHCLTCEMAGMCTSCRDPAKVLLFGECQYESCAHQYYLEFTTRACRECDWSCNVCKGPLHTDCLQCMEGNVLQDGVCAQGCAAGFYQDGETCLSCDAHCQECQGSQQCLRCRGPFALLQGRCLHACGRGYFLDSVRQQCAECPENCVECEGIHQCKVCKESSFLKKGLCTADCGPGFYADTRGRLCRENHHAPVIHANGSLLVEVGGTAALDVSFMTAQDPDGDADSMIFRVLQPPTNGHLFHIMGGRETRLKKEDTFSFSDFKDRAVRFTHAKGKSKSGHFTLLVTDQQLFSAPETINIQAVSFQAPYVLTSEPLLVNKGEKVLLTSSVLQIQDDDNPEDVLVVVRDPPQHGHLRHLLHDRPLQQFRLDDLVQEQLYYVHDGSDGPQDTFLLQISDGYSYQNLLVHINVAKMNVTSPLKPSNPTLWVGEGGMAQITSAHLGVKNKTSSDLKTLYTVVPSKERPRYGKLVLLVPMPADGPADGWQQLPDGRASLSTTSFSQRDVDVGAVWYQRFARGAQRDGFDLWVSSEDGVLGDSRSFEVGVVSETPGFPRLAAGARLHVTALEDRTTVITPSALSFVDIETPSENLVYDITVPLTQEQGTIEHKDRPYKPVYVFTQLDIDGGKIIYRPPSTPPHLQELYPYSFAGLPEFVTFNFTVSDGERTTPPIPFAIHLLANHQQPPVFQILDPVLEVSLGGRAPIGVQQLDVTDADTAPDDLEFLLEETPRHGTLLKVDGGVGSEMVNGDAFSFSDITRNVLQYEHAGITTENDAIVFTVTDGSSEATITVQVLVMDVKGDGPERHPEALLSMEVPEKSSTVITRSHLAYVDNKSPDEQIRFQIVSTPMYGILTRTDSASHHKELTEYSIFSMEDINDHSIRYVTSFETGNQPVTDIFHFIVYDGENNRLDSQMYTITITPVLKRPPVVTVHGDIKVEEGGRVHLSANHIIVSDPDTPKTELLVWLISPPKYGFIENTNQAGETGGAQIISPEVPFSVEDLMSDHIVYVQNIQQITDHHHDEFSFYISDGYTQTEAFNININIQQSKEEKTPLISVSNIQVDESSGVVITNSSLMVLGRDLPGNEVIFTVTKKPSYGKLRRRQSFSQPLENGRVLSQGSTFTYQDVLDKLLGYTPDSLSRGTDEVHFSVTDGVHTETCQLEFTMDIAKREGPRVATNRGLQLTAGSTSQITDQHLKGVDKDSDDLKLRYVITKDPTVGGLKLSKNGVLVQISVKGPITSFTQEEINKGFVQYQHEKGEKGGSFMFKFNLIDPEGNKVIDQSFFISVLEDRLPPSVVVNKGLVLDENTVKKITTLELLATDHDSEPGELVYRVTKQPQLGHLEYVAKPGTQIRTFTQADLASRKVQYIHTSEEEKHADDFTFTVSDGVNEVSQTFYITIRPVDDSLPVLQMQAMRVQEGVRKTITEFELKATDADTEEEFITFTVVQAPRHGTIERTHNGQNYRQTSTFTMDDIYQNRVSYNHDGSNSLRDRFTFTITDGSNLFFLVEEEGKEVVTVAPQKFRIEILPVDDGTPRIVTNLGLHWLEYMDNKATNLISKKELLTMDPDTEDEQLVYEVTVEPKHGFLETKLNPGSPITSFTQGDADVAPSVAQTWHPLAQTWHLRAAILFFRSNQFLLASTAVYITADINLGLIRYVLNEERIQETMDNFKFLVKDSKPNVVTDNVFHIQWSLISFEHASYNVSEQAGTVAVTVKRTGNLNQYSIVLCRTEQGTATSTPSTASQPSQQDYVEYAGQVQFDEREDTKLCTIVINDDQVFENIEMFSVELSMPAYALLGSVTRVKVHINDTEDEPTLQFDKKIHHVNESAGLALIPIERKGDTSSTASALCYSVSKSAQGSSLHVLQSGSDFKSRGMSRENRVIFGPGVSMSSCDVRLIDDSEYELSEEFELVLSDPSDNARIGDVSVAKVVIDGPNDASKVFLGNSSFTFSEDAGTIEIPVHRHGSDLSSLVSVWCATRPSKPPSATPGVDYIPSSKKIEFKPGKTVETCSLSIMDDIQNPAIEGSESFVVFLSSAQGAVLTEPFEASVIIEDTVQDIPQMQLEKSKYTVKEKDGILHIPIIRTGDLTLKSSVRCYTRTMSAMVMDDFEERTNTDSSRIIFHEGEKVKNCTVQINDDSIFEPEEEFQVHLGSPQGDHWTGAMVGIRDVATVTITNDEDAPTIEFEEATYQVREPPGLDGIEVVTIKVIRKGDQNRLSKVRCSTRDGSAQSGVDYNPKSRVLKFNPGMDHVLFKVEILSSEDREWHESFSVVLGPDDPVEAVLGEITVATVTVLDQEAAGSLILPAPPIVVSLSDYDYVQEVSKEENKKSPSAGYPLICVTPCDPHYPKYFVMRERCEEAGINQSSIHFSWEVAAPTDANGARSPFETVTDNTPFTSVNHKVLDSIYFSRRFHVRCVAQARDKAGHLGTPLRSNIVIISTEGSICHTPVTTGTARGFQAQSFVATLKYLDVKHKEHPNRIHITVQIPHQDGMFPLVSTLPLHNLHFLLSESIYRHQHICSNLVTLKDLEGISEAGFLEDVAYDSISQGPGYDRPYQFNPDIRESKTIQLYKHLNLKNCIWTFEAYYDMTELIDVCGGTVTADFQVRDSTQSFLTVQVPLYVSYIYVTAPRGWASLEHHTEMEFSFFYDTILWRTGIQTDSVLSARLQILRIYIREDGRLVIEFKTHAKFRGHFVLEHHTLPGHKSQLMAPDPLGGMHFDLQLLWSAQTFDSPYQLWRATSSYSRKDYSGEYTAFLIPCTVQPTQPWIDPGDKPLSCTAHAPEKFLVPIAFQQTNRPVPVVYSLNTEFQLCNNEKIFMMDPAKSDVSMAEMDYKGAFSMGQTLYGRVLWNPEQNLNAAYKLQLEKVYLCTGRDGYVPYFDPTGTLYNEGPQYGCIQPNKHLKHRFLLLDRKQPEVCDRYFHDVPFEASFASDISELHPMTLMPGVDGFTVKVDALYKVEAGHQWYLQVIYVIGPESISGPRIQRSLTYLMRRDRRDLVDRTGRLTLDDSLIYDNEGDQVKNGTNMKTLRLEMQPSVTFSPQADGSLTGGLAAASLLLLVCLASCFLLRKCRRKGKKLSLKNGAKEYPLNTKVEVFPANAKEQKNFNNKHCTVTNVNILNKNQEVCKVNSVKVKQVNLEVKLHNNLNDGTEV